MTRITDFLKGKFARPRRKPKQESAAQDMDKPVRANKSIIPLYLFYIMAFLLGRTRIIRTLVPFGPGFYVAYRTVLGGLSILAGACVLAGAASLRQWDLLIPMGLSIVGITVLTREEKRTGYPRIVNALIAGFCVFMARVVAGLATGLSFSLYLSAFMEALCTMVSGLIFIWALDLMSGAQTQGLQAEQTGQALVLLSLFAVGGFQDIQLFNLDIGVMIVMAVTLVLAYACGPSVGALAGILCGLVACMTGMEALEIIGQLGVIGVISGLGGKLGKLEAILGYLSAGLALAFFSDSVSLIRHRLMEQIIASLAILFITPGIRAQLADSVLGFGSASRRADRRDGSQVVSVEPWAPGPAPIFNVLSELGRLFEEARVSRAGLVESSGVYGSGSDNPALSGQAAGGRALGEAAPGAVLSGTGKRPDRKSQGRAGEPHGVHDLDIATIKHLFERTCYDCPERSFCWEDQFGETYENFVDLARKARLTGKIGFYDSSLALSDRCHRFREMVLHLNYEKHIDRLERQLSSIEADTIGCLAYQFKCLSQLKLSAYPSSIAGRGTHAYSRGADSAGEPTGGTGGEPAGNKPSPLKISVRGTTIPASGVEKPGDAWVRYDLDPGRTLLVLVDGMGKGEVAAKQSRDAVRLLKSLIDLRLDHTTCMSFLNSVLHLAWRPDSFVALDCVVIDAGVERAYFYKLGAPPSFIRKKDGNVLAVRGSNPPAGAITHVFCHGTSEPIGPGDLIFMVSDGVLRSSPVPARAEHMLMMRLSRLKEGSLGDYVKSVVNHSLRYQRQTPNDDITVVGVLIESI
ncbi:MAG TPA: SpoIIE family protein phosphatase [Bacillota bacterium]|nr:SpoIIE family protein phosphatase [Bacillota bacterium]HPT36004.1 SpoIIE family protein phosphatase [Bacillota bacterium]